MKTTLLAAALSLAFAAPALTAEPVTGYAPVNGLQMYYEIHGEGEPLLLLHGAYMSIGSNWAGLIPTLSQTRQVIAVELQAHGRTGDADRPITYAGMADDVAALMDHLKVEDAAVFGYSMGGGVALRLAMQHPEKVSRLIAASAAINYDAYPDDFYSMIEGFTPEMFKGSPFEAEYLKLSPNKDGFPNLVDKLKALDLDRFAWPEADLAKIAVPSLLIFGDADIVKPEHQVQMHKLLGGVLNGDMTGLPKTQILVLPGTTHIGVFFNPANVEIMKSVIPAFLTQQLPAPPMAM